MTESSSNPQTQSDSGTKDSLLDPPGEKSRLWARQISPLMLLSAFIVLLASSFAASLFLPRSLLASVGYSPSGGLPVSEQGVPRDIIDLGYSKYLGNRTYPHAVSYLGLPYAEPPLGERRFRNPVELDKARITKESKTLEGGVVDARAYPDFCVQASSGLAGHDAGGAGVEDCLKLNVYAPVGATHGSDLPVLVYFHGGGYIYGNPANWPFDHWVQQSPNVVIVSVYYRLAAFGFLSSSAFLSDPSLGDLNAGFLDQIQSLKWIHENVAAFGGDPRRVTINGESAGGSSVELHLVASANAIDAYGHGGLIHAAIAQSVYRTPVPLPEQQDALFDYFSKKVGCGTGGVSEKMACLRTANISAISLAQDDAYWNMYSTDMGYKSFHPVVDGKVITDYPTKLILAGKFSKVPLIVGATTNETLSRLNDTPMELRRYSPEIYDEDIHAILGLYPLSEFADSNDLRHQTVTGDVELRCARTIMAEAWTDAQTKVFAYRYNQPVPGAVLVKHAVENWMMFKGTNVGPNGTTTFQPQSPQNTAFAEELIAYWVSFVRSGDPNTFKLPRSPVWNEYKLESERLVLQQPVNNSTVESGSHLEKETDEEVKRCRLIASQAEQQQN